MLEFSSKTLLTYKHMYSNISEMPLKLQDTIQEFFILLFLSIEAKVRFFYWIWTILNRTPCISSDSLLVCEQLNIYFFILYKYWSFMVNFAGVLRY